MVTYPSTHGCSRMPSATSAPTVACARRPGVHGPGANMKAQVGLTSTGADWRRCLPHQLHKTFAIRTAAAVPVWARFRGGAPLALSARPSDGRHGRGQAIPPVSAAPWGSASILLISYGYIKSSAATASPKPRSTTSSTPTTSSRVSKGNSTSCTRVPTDGWRTSDLRPAQVQGLSEEEATWPSA